MKWDFWYLDCRLALKGTSCTSEHLVKPFHTPHTSLAFSIRVNSALRATWQLKLETCIVFERQTKERYSLTVWLLDMEVLEISLSRGGGTLWARHLSSLADCLTCPGYHCNSRVEWGVSHHGCIVSLVYRLSTETNTYLSESWRLLVQTIRQFNATAMTFLKSSKDL